MGLSESRLLTRMQKNQSALRHTMVPVSSPLVARVDLRSDTDLHHQSLNNADLRLEMSVLKARRQSRHQAWLGSLDQEIKGKGIQAIFLPSSGQKIALPCSKPFTNCLRSQCCEQFEGTFACQLGVGRLYAQCRPSKEQCRDTADWICPAQAHSEDDRSPLAAPVPYRSTNTTTPFVIAKQAHSGSTWFSVLIMLLGVQVHSEFGSMGSPDPTKQILAGVTCYENVTGRVFSACGLTTSMVGGTWLVTCANIGTSCHNYCVASCDVSCCYLPAAEHLPFQMCTVPVARMCATTTSPLPLKRHLR